MGGPSDSDDDQTENNRVSRRLVLQGMLASGAGAGLSSGIVGEALAAQGNSSSRTIVLEQGGNRFEATPLSAGEPVGSFVQGGGPGTVFSTGASLQDDVSHLLVYEGPDGTLSLVVAHDSGDDDGGAVDLEFAGLPGEGSWVFKDSAANDFGHSASDPPDYISWRWAPGWNDGGAFSPLGDPLELTISPGFNEDSRRWGEVDSGRVEAWQFLSGDADNPDRIQLNLDEPVTITIGDKGSRGRVLEDFEDFDKSRYGGAVSKFNRTTAPVQQGSYAGELTKTDSNADIGVSTTDTTIEAPITLRGWMYVGEDTAPKVTFFTQSEDSIPESLNVGLEDDDGTFELNYHGPSGGWGGDEFALTSFDFSADTWYEFEVDVNEDGSTVTATLFDENGGQLEQISGTPSKQLTSGGFGFGVGGNGTGSVYFDDYRVGGQSREESPDLELTDVRLVQRMEGTRFINTNQDLVDIDPPRFVDGLPTGLVFNLDGDPDDPVDRTVEVEWETDDGDTYVDSIFVPKRGPPNKPWGIEKLAEETNKFEVANELLDRASKFDNDLPIFTQNLSKLESVEVRLVPDGNSGTTIRHRITDIPETADMPRFLTVGIIALRDPLGGNAYGTGDNGRVGSDVEARVDEMLKYLEKTYPASTVAHVKFGFPEEKRDTEPIIGWIDRDEDGNPRGRPELIHRDMQFANQVLESRADDFGGLYDDGFDLKVFVAPQGYFDFHQKSGTHGAHKSRHPNDTFRDTCIPDTQPGMAVAIEEDASTPVLAHEGGHHFLPTCVYQTEIGNKDMAARDSGKDDNIDESHARLEQPDDPIALVSTSFDLEEGDARTGSSSEEDICVVQAEALMSPSMPGRNAKKTHWPDAHMHNALVDTSEGKDEFVPANAVTLQPNAPKEPVLSGIARIDPSDIQPLSLTVYEGRPMASEGEPEVRIDLLNAEGGVLDHFETLGGSVLQAWTEDVSASSRTVTENVFSFTTSFPEETVALRFTLLESGDTTRINPLELSLRDAINRIPDSGFRNDPENRRSVLLNKVEALAKQMEREAYRGASRKLQNDIRDKVQKWLQDEFESAPNRTTKEEILELIDNYLDRLNSINGQSGNSGNGNPGRGD